MACPTKISLGKMLDFGLKERGLSCGQENVYTWTDHQQAEWGWDPTKSVGNLQGTSPFWTKVTYWTNRRLSCLGISTIQIPLWVRLSLVLSCLLSFLFWYLLLRFLHIFSSFSTHVYTPVFNLFSGIDCSFSLTSASSQIIVFSPLTGVDPVI